VNLLYLSCHEVLEYDELRMFREIPSLNVFSPGAYIEPEKGWELRPGLKLHYPQEWMDAWSTITPTEEFPDPKYHLTPESVAPFDTILIMHHWEWVFRNWDVIKGKRVIWRDIGQTIPEDEKSLILKAQDMGVEIVRYWEGYQSRENYTGHDAIIPFGKYKDDFPEWKGGRREILGLSQSIQSRGDTCRFKCWEESTEQIPRVMLGKGNEGLSYWGGNASYSGILNALATHKAFWYGGTHPAPYTLALMEAMFVGIPVFTVREPGWESAVESLLPFHSLCHDSKGIREMISKLSVQDSHLISNLSRTSAVRYWDASTIKPKWERFLHRK
jgi:hypothetical protein